MIVWTEEKISELQALLREDLSYQQAANRLSHEWGFKVTKNIIVGAIHRHLPKLVKLRAKHRVKVKKTNSRKKQLRQLLPGLNALFGLPEPIRDRDRLSNVIGATCQYIHGEPKDRNFCGKQAVRDSSIPHAAPVWCAAHIREVYVPKALKKKKVAIKKGGRIVWETVA